MNQLNELYLMSYFSQGINVVGNAKSLYSETKYGELIDRKKTIRFNWPHWDSKYTGTRQDVICTNRYEWIDNGSYYFLICQTRPSNSLPYTKSFYQYPKDLLKKLKTKLNSKPSNGIRILYLLNYLSIKNVNIFGFDWKNTSSTTIEYTLTKNPSFKDNAHNYKKEKKICLDLIDKNNWTLMGER